MEDVEAETGAESREDQRGDSCHCSRREPPRELSRAVREGEWKRKRESKRESIFIM